MELTGQGLTKKLWITAEHSRVFYAAQWGEAGRFLWERLVSSAERRVDPHTDRLQYLLPIPSAGATAADVHALLNGLNGMPAPVTVTQQTETEDTDTDTQTGKGDNSGNGSNRQ